MGIETILISAAVTAAFSAGSYAINYALAGNKKQTVDDGRQIDPRVQGSSYGSVITRGYGTVELAGQVIWATAIKDTPTRTPGQRSKRGSTPDQIHHHYTRSFGVQVAAGPAAGVVRIKADDKTIYESATLGEINTGEIHIQVGSETQTPNTWYEADKGVGCVSAHRGTVNIWFLDFPIDEYGDRIPNIRAEVVFTEDETLQGVVEGECAVAGYAPSQISAAALSGDVVDGFFVNTLGPVRASLEPLSKAFQFDGVEFDGKINFRKRPRAAVATVGWDELGCVEEGEGEGEDEPAPRLKLRRGQSSEIPIGVEVLYYDKGRNYEEGTQGCTRQNFTSRETGTHGFNLVMAPQAANRLAKIIAATGWAERTPVDVALPPEYFVHVAGDVLLVPKDETETEFIELRIEKMSFSTPGVVRVTGREQMAEAYTQVGEASAGEAAPVPPPVEAPCPTRAWLSDRYPFRRGEEGDPGFYVAGAPDSCAPVGAVYRGFSLIRDIDGAGDYRQLSVNPDASTIGTATTTLPLVTGLDTTSAPRVQLGNGTLSSITDDAFNNDPGANLLAWGDETLQARDVLNLGGGVYELSHIRRGMFGTAAESHPSGVDVVLLDRTVKRVTITKDEIGKTSDFLAVSAGRTVAETTPVSFTYGACGIEPGGDAPSAPQNDAVTQHNGTTVLRWEKPAENTETLRGYKLTVYEDAGHTTPLAGYDSVEVEGNEFTLPYEAGNPTRYYKVTAVNELGEGSAAASGSFASTPATAAAHKDAHKSGGSDAFTSADLLEAVVKRLRESGGADLLMGAVADGQFLRRSGTSVVGAATASPGPRAVTHLSANTALTASAQIVLVDTSAGDVTLTLPSGAAAEITVKNRAGANRVILDPSGSETIDGAATAELAAGDRATVAYDTTNARWESV